MKEATMTNKTRLVAVVGPPASGKSALALELAERYGGEIVSCDSMQLYRHMDIGTAKPDAEELKRAPHHMIDIAEPTEVFSCADYVSLADKVIRDIHSKGKYPIICGGTGLYLDALLREKDFNPGITDDNLRAELLAFAEKNGAQALHDELRKIDAESAEQIHPNNVKRVARAIEIYRLGGIKKSEIDRMSQTGDTRFDIRCVGLFYKERAELYERIDSRVDKMIEAGLEAETRSLLAQGVFDVNSTAAQAIGYKELLAYIGGEETLDTAIEKLKIATRRYAKRQITWFSSKQYVTPLEVIDSKNEKTFEDIVNNTEKVFFS
jgi:tRNA dimethylallyltransferase